MGDPERYEAYRVLQRNDIPCVVWLEDALGHYGMNTVLFRLHIIVASIDTATEALLLKGWTIYKPRPNDLQSFLSDMPTSSYRRLLPPDWVDDPVEPWPPLPPDQQVQTQPELVLFSADFWNISLYGNKSMFPPLEMLVDSLITATLDSPDGSFLQSRLSVYICALYSEITGVKHDDLVASLSPANRHFHHDGVNGIRVTTIPGIKRQREFRDKLRESCIVSEPVVNRVEGDN
ncbi:hypothetical protein BKA67DRAFT_581176 [Truncatella angustata]|uniref:Uncharacterized protein n=1 Tax=Truncatella angustata TaxID=152316 RepID=A0A9P8UC61_9PEZI|nr:uncharacterized protein BKA67DRAFT_581176 [Truncatella angustata]KAH6646982.1 hypothetical protein BKA67DRAFT_581176 [Truncatella angustata]